MTRSLQIRIHGAASLPALIYLPGIHGDWTLVTSFRSAIAGRVRFVEFVYPSMLDGSLTDYADAVIRALGDAGIHRGWLLAESFGSQVAWAMIERGFAADGLILAGGFVRYPFPWGLRLAGKLCGGRSAWPLAVLLWIYPRYARFRHRQAPETLLAIQEFVKNRIAPGDRAAMTHRLKLIEASDPRRTARVLKVPVYSLAGFWDPIVFWGPVRRWLKKECPAFQEARILFWADHNVLSTQPQAAVRQVLDWMGRQAERIN
jgi:pimeloyl-ACP methyl ester carboxylesterase